MATSMSATHPAVIEMQANSTVFHQSTANSTIFPQFIQLKTSVFWKQTVQLLELAGHTRTRTRINITGLDLIEFGLGLAGMVSGHITECTGIQRC